MNLSGEAKALIGLGLATLLIIVGAVFLLGKSDTNTPQAQKIDQKQLIKEDSRKITSPGAKVTVVEFLDYECEACGAAHPVVNQILKDYKGKINYVVRHFPNHKNSILAGNAVEAAGEQGKYWEYHNLLFENQKEWGEKQEPQTQLFLSYAEELGLDMTKFETVLNSGKYNTKLNRDKQEAISLGVNGTPTFFINGLFAGNVMSYEEFKSKIDAKL